MDDNEAKIDLGIAGLGPAEHIGRGGFADVYRAEQFSLRRTVAVKVLRAQATDSDAEARFDRECQAIGAVSDHPHIVGVHEGGFTRNGRAYLVMEYLPGGSLYERLVDDGPLPVPEIVDIGIKIGKALAVAHRAGVLHRDVKPANIMISAYGEPALGDFGIARVEGGHQTATGMVTASFAHAAPEVLEGHPSTPAADIYSLGSTIFELMTGQAPYYRPEDESIWPLMKRILSEPMPSPESVGMSQKLGSVFIRATARDLAVRYSDADDLVRDLNAVASDPLALIVDPPVEGGFVPAPRPPGGNKGRSMAKADSTGLPNRLPPPVRPDLTLAQPVDTAPATTKSGFETTIEESGSSLRDDDRSAVIGPVTEIGHGPNGEIVDPGAAQQPETTQLLPGELLATGDIAAPGIGDEGRPAGVASAESAVGPDGVQSAVPATTMDLPPPVATGGGERRPRSRRRAPVMVLAVVAVVAAGGALLATVGLDPINQLLGRDGSGATDVASGIHGGPEPTGDSRIGLVAGNDGPLAEGERYEVTLSGVDPGASVQLIVDGEPYGPAAIAEDGRSLTFQAPAGRHTIAAEVGVEAGIELTNGIGFYGLRSDGPTPGFRTTVASVKTGDQRWAEALTAYDRLVADGHVGLELIATADAPALTGGYWTISAVGFGADADAAEQYCIRFNLESPIDCYVSFVETGIS